MDNIAATPKAGQGILRLLDRAFLTAHLFTGNLRQAEEATLDAIDSWRPGEEPEAVLFQNVLDAAARAQVEPSTNTPDPSASYLPNELKAVLRLAPQLRRCFVLRILAGLPAKVCARLLCLQSDMVERYTCDALRCLANGT
jgi:DNA-directed RNA polymerase specialized sigma24 family protein